MTDSDKRFNYQALICIKYIIEENFIKNNDVKIFYDNINDFLSFFNIDELLLNKDIIQSIDDIIILDEKNQKIKFIQVKSEDKENQNKWKKEVQEEIESMIKWINEIKTNISGYKITLILYNSDTKNLKSYIEEKNKDLNLENIFLELNHWNAWVNKMDEIVESIINLIFSKLLIKINDVYIDSFCTRLQNNKPLISKSEFLNNLVSHSFSNNTFYKFIKKLLVFENETWKSITNTTYKFLINHFKDYDKKVIVDPIKLQIDKFINDNKVNLETNNNDITDIINKISVNYPNQNSYLIFLELLDDCTLNLGIDNMGNKVKNILVEKTDLEFQNKLEDIIWFLNN